MQILTFKPFPETDGEVTAYLHTPIMEMGKRREIFPAVVVCPGGGYRFCSQREDEPVAMAFFARGYQVFVLHYSTGPEKARDFLPLAEASKTVSLLRANSAQWRVDPGHIAVCGFSAGGHLAGSLGTMWKDPELLRRYDFQDGSNRPDAMILCYPVVLAGRFAHVESTENVSGHKQGEPGYDYFSLDRHVGPHTCPAFLWHTAEDDVVPVENTIAMMAALSREKIPFEAHVLPSGPHGMSVCTQEVGSLDGHNARWVDLCLAWLDREFGYCL